MIANKNHSHYANHALSKILKLVLTDYKFSTGVQSARAFFVRNISMRSHIYVELWRDTFECAGHLLSLSVNPLQLRTNQMTVISEAPISTGVHTHV
nr:hypothetical protein [Acinetobacter boissieri]